MEAICKVSLESLSKNFTYFQNRIKQAQVIPVVKADAYGHGSIQVTRHLFESFGVKTFAVATFEEARELAAHFPTISILIFSKVFASELPSLPQNAILTIGSMEDVEILQSDRTTKRSVHINVNTGMNRLGISPDQALHLIQENHPGLCIEGAYSHFSSSDTQSGKIYEQQNRAFEAFAQKARSVGFKGLIHIANSAAGLRDDLNQYDAIRVGIGLYGYDTTAQQRHQRFLSPAMTILAPLVRVAKICAGESVSYAEKWQATVDTHIGTLRIGYADGYNRALTNRGVVSLNGKAYPVVGTVTMDHIMVDLGADQPQPGELFEVMGGANPQTQIKNVSRILSTIPYEVCCAISPRVRRQY